MMAEDIIINYNDIIKFLRIVKTSFNINTIT